MEESEKRSSVERVLPMVFLLSKEEEEILMREGKVSLQHRHADNAQWIGHNVRVDGENDAHDVLVETGKKSADNFPDWEYVISLPKKTETQE